MEKKQNAKRKEQAVKQAPAISHKPKQEQMPKKPQAEKKEKPARIAHPKENAEQKKTREQLRAQIAVKNRPRFRGRFGKPNVRRKGIEKWQKWRKPRGIDIRKGIHKGRIPNSGYGTPRKIRFLHPSGLAEVRIANLRELDALFGHAAVRIQASVGKKKRKELVLRAQAKGFFVLN